MQACMKFGIDPDVMFAKDRMSRALIVGSSMADNAINTMRQYDRQKEREMEAKRERER